jgi:hypothetical protein
VVAPQHLYYKMSGGANVLIMPRTTKPWTANQAARAKVELDGDDR